MPESAQKLYIETIAETPGAAELLYPDAIHTCSECGAKYFNVLDTGYGLAILDTKHEKDAPCLNCATPSPNGETFKAEV